LRGRLVASGVFKDDFLLGDSTQRTVRLFSLRGLIPLPTIPLLLLLDPKTD
jgi:hypothetical protein